MSPQRGGANMGCSLGSLLQSRYVLVSLFADQGAQRL